MERYVVGEDHEKEAAGPLKWPIVAILLVALALRLVGLGYGLPYALDFEEDRNVSQAFNHTLMLRSTKLVPDDMSRSALPSYVFAAEYGALYGNASLFDRISSLIEYKQLFLIRPSLFIVLGRIAATAFGLFAVYLVYLICKRAFDWGVGVLAAVFMAVSPHQVHFSRLATGDIMALVFALGGLYFLLKVMMEKNFGSSLYAALLLGLAAGTAFEYVAFLPAWVVVYLVAIPAGYRVRSSITGLVLGVCAFAAAAAAPNAALLLSAPATFPREFAAAALSRIGVMGLGNLAGVRETFALLAAFDIFAKGVGWGLLAAGVLGLLLGLFFGKWHRNRYLAVALFAVVPAVLLFPADGRYFANWAFLMTPALAMGAAMVIYRFCWRPRMPASVGLGLMAVLAAAVAVQPLAQTAVSTLRKSVRDTRVQYARWASENLPDGATVLATPGARFLKDIRILDGGGKRWEPFREEVLSAWGSRTFTVVLTGRHQLSRRPPASAGVDYVVVDSWYERHLGLEASGANSRLARRFALTDGRAQRAARDLSRIDEARRTGTIIKVFSEPSGNLSGYGPSIEVIEVARPEPAEAELPEDTS